jgi:FKBP-type peptidyl-prolyl cis-trans isomerase
MTLSLSRKSLLALSVLAAVALGLPLSALAQAPAQPTMAAQVENPPADAQKTASGLAYIIESPGTGTVHPTDMDMVKMTAMYWTRESEQSKPGYLALPNAPKPMALLVLPGLKEALGMMTSGEKMKLWIPEKLAFKSAPDKPKGPLMLEVFLLDVIPLPTTPPDVAAVPRDAEKTKSGLASKVLKPGTGSVHPLSTSTVTVHYSLWTPDGKILESSVVNGAPVTFVLNKVIKGWTEGVQLMVAGEKRRFWIPGKLAYDESPDPAKPKGMLVFEIELIAVDGNR